MRRYSRTAFGAVAAKFKGSSRAAGAQSISAAREGQAQELVTGKGKVAVRERSAQRKEKWRWKRIGHKRE